VAHCNSLERLAPENAHSSISHFPPFHPPATNSHQGYGNKGPVSSISKSEVLEPIPMEENMWIPLPFEDLYDQWSDFGSAWTSASLDQIHDNVTPADFNSCQKGLDVIDGLEVISETSPGSNEGAQSCLNTNSSSSLFDNSSIDGLGSWITPMSAYSWDSQPISGAEIPEWITALHCTTTLSTAENEDAADAVPESSISRKQSIDVYHYSVPGYSQSFNQLSKFK